MPSEVALTLYERNNEDVALTFTHESDDSALDITGLTLEGYIKTNPTKDDPAALVDFTKTDSAGGKATWHVPSEQIATTNKFWRVDTLDSSGNRKTSHFGKLKVVNL